MKIGFLTFERWEGRPKESAGSSRIRARWVIKHWEGAEEFVQGRKYDVVIYQKAYFVDHAKEFKGIKILDICDPDWLHWGYRTVELLQHCNAVTTSTQELADAISKFTDKPVICIPDRIDLDWYSKKKVHVGDAKNAVWYGYSTGFPLLNSAIPSLKKLGLGLIVIAERGFVLPAHFEGDIEVRNLPWSYENVNNDIITGDIVLNPRSTKNKWKFKSNNKTLGAWALGMPVATSAEELQLFMKEESRKLEAEKRLKEIEEVWDVRKSAEEYKKLVAQLLS